VFCFIIQAKTNTLYLDRENEFSVISNGRQSVQQAQSEMFPCVLAWVPGSIDFEVINERHVMGLGTVGLGLERITGW